MDTPQPPSTQQIDAYLDRIDAVRHPQADADFLRVLHRKHLRAVPFENLSIHLGEDIVLADQPLLDKIVGARRGGFCYELNGAFAVLLRALGFRVSLLQARVYGSDGKLGIPFDHLALKVGTDSGGPWLVDVGFGDHSHYPLALGTDREQEDPGGRFTVEDGPRGDLDVHRDGKPQYRIDLHPRELEEFEVGAWFNRTSPASHFTRSLVCSRLTEDGRITLSGDKLVTTVDGERHEEHLGSDAEILAAYRDHFGLVLGSVPTVRKITVQYD
ncbi:arylamine N-acetyltransferase family protein [Streptomyces sp. NBC_01465]|uniref:arylamine N-acetyltransferase family protein n=1 Tax=Streptomyces sp. NBC_01465 TaxID=2903878 RepID=UPI002E378E33|nr:arylamine N-acetyltransferase [Streptomyces sp. NBC_01465]